MPTETSTMAATAVVRTTSAERGAGGDRHQHRAQAGDPEPDASPPGVPGGWPRRMASSTLTVPPGPPADGRPPRHGPRRAPAGGPRCAGRRRAPAPGPAGSTVPRRTGAPASSRATTVPRARSATRSASSGSSGSSTVDRDRLGRGPLQLAHHQPAGVGGRPPVHQTAAVARRVGAGARGQARVGPWPIGHLAGASSSSSRRSVRPSAARRDVELDGSGSCTRRVHHCSANGAAEAMSSVTAVVHPAADGQQRDAIVDRGRCRPTGPTKTSGPGGSTGTDAQPGAGLDGMSTGSPAMASAGALRTSTRARVTTTHGPTIPMRSDAEDEVAEELHPPGAGVVRDQPPQRDDHRPRRRSAPRGGPVAPSGSRPRRWRRLEELPDHCGRLRVVPSSPSTVRRRWARQATATAFTSSGTT